MILHARSGLGLVSLLVFGIAVTTLTAVEPAWGIEGYGESPAFPIDFVGTAVPDGPDAPDGSPLPSAHHLAPCRPNPFNATTTIAYDLATSGEVELSIYDVLGRRVRTLEAGVERAAGHHEVLWHGRDDAGWPVASGVYLCRLRVADFVQVRRVTLVK
jgi:hypothetical protein